MISRWLLIVGLLLASCLTTSAQRFQADSGVSVSSTIVANNTTAIVISARSSNTVYQVDAYNNGGTIAYIKLYNATSATCGTGTPQARYMIPFGQSSSGGGFVTPNINGDAYSVGITMCVTTGIADADASAPAASTYIVNVHFKSATP